MFDDSDSPPSSVLGELQEELFTCGGCGQCIKCRDQDSDYASGRDYATPQRLPFTCYICNQHFATEFLCNIHKLEHQEEEIDEFNFCDAAFLTTEDLTKHETIQHPVTDLQDTGKVEKEVADVEKASDQPYNVKPIKGIVKKRRGRPKGLTQKCGVCQKGFASRALLKRHICNINLNSSTDTDSLEFRTTAKQLKLSPSKKAFGQKPVFESPENVKRKAVSSQRPFESHPELTCPEILSISSDDDCEADVKSKAESSQLSETYPDLTCVELFNFYSDDDYEADASSISAEGSLNTSHSSVEKDKFSPIRYLPKFSVSSKPTGARSRGKRNVSSRPIFQRRARVSISDPEPGHSRESKNLQHCSELEKSSTSSSKKIDKPSTSEDDCCFKLPFDKGKMRQPPIGKRIQHTRKPLKSSGEQKDPLSSRKANMNRLSALLELPPTLNRKSVGVSVLSPKFGPSYKSHKRQHRSEWRKTSNYSCKEICKSSTSEDDCCFKFPSDKERKRQPPSRFRVPSPTGEGIHDTIQPLKSSGEEKDPLSSRKANMSRLHASELRKSSTSACKEINKPSTSEDDCCIKLPSVKRKKRQPPPWFKVPSLPIGEGTHDTHQPLKLCGEEKDPLPSSKANARIPHASLDSPPISNLELSRSDQPSTSRLESGHQLPLGGSSKRRHNPAIISSSNFGFKREYKTDPSSTSSGDHDYCIPFGAAREAHPHSQIPAPSTPGNEGSWEIDQPSLLSRSGDYEIPSGKASEQNLSVVSPTTCSNVTFDIDQPSTSSGYRGYASLFGGSGGYQPIPMPFNASISSSEGPYETHKPSTSSCDPDDHTSLSEEDRQLPKTVNLVGKDCGGDDFSTRSLNKHLKVLSIRQEIERSRLHTGGAVIKFKCEICGKEYKYKPALKKHEKRHFGAKNPTCEKCGKQFSTIYLWKSHLRHVCGPDKLVCRSCGKTFTRKYSLKVHESRNHPLSKETDPEKDS